MLRKATLDKVNAFLKKAQEEEAPAEEGPAPDFPMDSLGDPDEEAAAEEADEGEVEDRVEKLEETMDIVVDGLEQHKEVIEELLLDKDSDSGSDGFEEFLEEKDEEDEEEVTEDEFGLEEEARMNKTNLARYRKIRSELRSKRNLRKSSGNRRQTPRNPKLARAQIKARLRRKLMARRAAMKRAKGEEYLRDQWMLKKMKDKSFKPMEQKPTMGKPVNDKTPDLFAVANLTMEYKKGSWQVLDANERAFCTIPRGEFSAGEYKSPKFAHLVIKTMNKLGLKAALRKFKARKLSKKAATPKKAVFGRELSDGNVAVFEDDGSVATRLDADNIYPINSDRSVRYEHPGGIVLSPSDAKKLNIPIEASASVASKHDAADYGRRFRRALKLALTAMNKNLVGDNPLKGALFELMGEMGIDDPAPIIESAFAQAADEHFETALQHTQRYMDMSDEAFVEAESMILDSSVAVPSAHKQTSDEARQLRQRAAQSSMPFSTTSESEPEVDEWARIQAAAPRPKLAQLNVFQSNK